MRWNSSSAGKHVTRTLRRISSRLTCSWTQCGGVRPPGRACASIFNMCLRRCIRRRTQLSRPEHLLELVSGRDLELIVAAVARRLVRPPPEERRRMPETIALQVVVLHFAHSFDAERLP